MEVVILDAPFDPWCELSSRQARRTDLAGRYGGTAVFVGTMRGANEGRAVTRMSLEHYPGMTEGQIRAIGDEAAGHWAIQDSLVLHRSGVLEPGEPIVLVATWAEHRGDALEACRYITEGLKARAPFWKKELGPDGEQWVERNTDGYASP
ncbi:MAG: molybdenum cofactor biosynthesis protein MoaE [Pseudomonadota bacterium]